MKTLKELRESYDSNYLNEASTFSKFDPKVEQGFPSDKKIPMMLILKRKAIRIYPDNQKVALYYIEALDKYVTIPFGTGVPTVTESEDLNEVAPLIGGVLGAAIRFAGPSIMRGAGHILKGAGKDALSASRFLAPGATAKAEKVGSAINKGIKKYQWRRNARAKVNARGKTSDRTTVIPTPGFSGSMQSGNDYTGSSIVTKGRGDSYQFGQVKPIISTERTSVSQHDPLSRSPSSIQKFYRLQGAAAITPNQMYESLKEIKNNKKDKNVKFLNEEEIAINTNIANNLLNLYESLNKKNKQKMLEKLCENMDSFKKIVSFASKNKD